MIALQDPKPNLRQSPIGDRSIYIRRGTSSTIGYASGDGGIGLPRTRSRYPTVTTGVIRRIETGLNTDHNGTSNSNRRQILLHEQFESVEPHFTAGHPQAKGRRAQIAARKQNPAASSVSRQGKLKPGAHWSDEYKERMQADMDALTSR